MSCTKATTTDSVLDDIRSTIASLESLRASRIPQRDCVSEVPSAGRSPGGSADYSRSPLVNGFAVAATAAYPASALQDSGSDRGSEQRATPRDSATPFVKLRSTDKTAKIMIVDDEPLNVMTFRQHLKMEGYENFVTTSNSREALHLLLTWRPAKRLVWNSRLNAEYVSLKRLVSN